MAQRDLNQKRGAFFADDLNIPSAFDLAIEFFINKGILTRSEFLALETAARRKAFTLAADANLHIIEGVKTLITQDFVKGVGTGDIVTNLSDYFDKMGAGKKEDYYLRQVVLNAVQESLSEGKEKVFDDTEADEFPFYQFHTVGDDRVRGAHRKLDAFTYDRNDPIWKRLRPPLSHGCRCGRSLVHKDENRRPSSTARYQKISSSINEGAGFEFTK